MQNKRCVGAWGLNRVINNEKKMFLGVKMCLGGDKIIKTVSIK